MYRAQSTKSQRREPDRRSGLPFSLPRLKTSHNAAAATASLVKVDGAFDALLLDNRKKARQVAQLTGLVSEYRAARAEMNLDPLLQQENATLKADLAKLRKVIDANNVKGEPSTEGAAATGKNNRRTRQHL